MQIKLSKLVNLINNIINLNLIKKTLIESTPFVSYEVWHLGKTFVLE